MEQENYRQMRVSRALWIAVFAAVVTLAGLFALSTDASAGVVGTMAQAGANSAETLPPGTLPIPPKVTVVHAAPISSTLSATAVDVCDENSIPVSPVSPELVDFQYGDWVTLTLVPGDYDWKVATSGSSCADLFVDIPPFTLLNGTLKLLIIIGENVNQEVDVLVIQQNVGGPTLYVPLVVLDPSAAP